MFGAPAAETETDRVAAWQEDLSFFAAHFASGHIDFSKLYNQTQFNNEIAALRADAARLSDAEITLRLMKLVASANVGHTHVNMPLFKPFHRLPLELKWYSDELAIVGAAPEYSSAIGARVLHVGKMTPEQLLAAVAPYISHETEAALRDESPGYLTLLELLEQSGVASVENRVEFNLARPGTEPVTMAVEPRSPVAWKIENMYDVLHVPQALYRKEPLSYYWYEYLPDSRALYIQYNRCDNDSKFSFSQFTRGLFAFADSHYVERVVIDLRFNGGGSNRVINPLIDGLKSRGSLRSHVYVLTGPSTFSAAVDAAVALRDEFHAVLVGETAGGRPNDYGNTKTLTLPNSQLKVQYSTQFFHMVKDGDPPALQPDIPTPLKLQDVLAGRDPVLDAALHDSHGR